MLKSAYGSIEMLAGFGSSCGASAPQSQMIERLEEQPLRPRHGLADALPNVILLMAFQQQITIWTCPQF
jgi:hypothetical protein